MEQQQTQQHHQKLHQQQHNQQNHQQQMQKQTGFEKPLNKRIELDQRDAWPHETQSERGYVIKSDSTSHAGMSSHLTHTFFQEISWRLTHWRLTDWRGKEFGLV